MLLLPAVLLGMLFAIPCSVLLGTAPDEMEIDSDFGHWAAGFAAGIALLFGTLTYFVFKVRDSTFRLSPTQLRVLWLGGFLVGLAGAPLIASML